MLTRLTASSTPRLVAAAVARPALPSGRRVTAAATPPSEGGDESTATPLPREARDSEASAVSLRAVRPQAQLAGAAAALQSKLAGEDPVAAARPSSSTFVLGAGDGSEAKWRELDEKVNEYPDARTFKGIGTAGADRATFAADIVRAIESVVGPVPPSAVAMRDSSGGRYVSITVGPVIVNSGDEVIRVYAAMKKEAGSRLKWYI